MTEEIKTLQQCQKEVAAKHGLGEQLVTGHKVSYFDEATQMYASQFKPSAPEPAPVDVEKPDFDDMAAEYFSKTTFVDDDAMNHALYRYSQGAERIWKDHVLPLHSIIKSKEEEIARLKQDVSDKESAAIVATNSAKRRGERIKELEKDIEGYKEQLAGESL